MKEIPTAEEFVKQYQKGADYFCITKGEAINKLIEFAKLHVEAALESASKEGKIIDEDGDAYHQPHIFHCNGEEYKNWIDKNSILNAYPLNLIK